MVVRSARCAAAVLALLLGCVTACGGSDDEPALEPPTRDLEASIAQFRFDEGTRQLHTGITNHSSKPITVTSADIDWPGFDWEPVSLPDEPVQPGQTAAFRSSFGKADCRADVTEQPRIEARVNGVRRDLELHLDDPTLFRRLWENACAGQRLADAASVTMSIGRSVVRDNGVPYFEGTVDLKRPHVPGEVLTVVDLGGSVLFDVLPSQGRRLEPVQLPASTASMTIPIRVGPTQRCDAHTRTNASQPFLLSVFTRIPGEPVHRTITIPDKATQLRLFGLLDRYCAQG